MTVYSNAIGGPRLTNVMVKSLIVIHYFLCSYVILSFLAWHLLNLNINVARFEVNEYYGFRPSAFGEEAAWTAFGIAATFTGIFYLAPKRRLATFVSMAVAFALLTSLTGYLFLLSFSLAYLKHKKGILRWLVVVCLAAAVAAGGFYVYSDRIATILSGADASISMRYSSARTATTIIASSFPLGVGYGDFQGFANYVDPYILLGLEAGTLGYYKSDMFALNVVAELGIVGVFIVLVTAKVFLCRRSYLPFVYFLALMLATGTILIQATLVVAAIAGMLDYQQRMLLANPASDQGLSGPKRLHALT